MSSRTDKWTAKLSGDVRKQRYDAQKPQMVKLETEATNALVKIEEEVKQLIRGELLLHVPYYIIFGKELYRLSKSSSSQAWINEAEILQAKWTARGLNGLVLNKIKEFYLQCYKAWTYFLLDTSLLDGEDRLS